jgi:hypothetical protein
MLTVDLVLDIEIKNVLAVQQQAIIEEHYSKILITKKTSWMRQNETAIILYCQSASSSHMRDSRETDFENGFPQHIAFAFHSQIDSFKKCLEREPKAILYFELRKIAGKRVSNSYPRKSLLQRSELG